MILTTSEKVMTLVEHHNLRKYRRF